MKEERRVKNMIKRKMILEISLQHRNEVEDAVKFNMENDYNYILVDDNNLICYDNLAYLLRVGYIMQIYADQVTLKHKNYKLDEDVKNEN